jgi:hypothetical protein
VGVDWKGAAVLGCEVTGKTEKVTVKSKTEKAPIDGWDTIKQAGLSCYSTTDGERQFVGVGVGAWGGDDAAHLPLDATELAAAKDKIRMVLAPLSLWDEKSFGLWAVLYCSY